METTKINKVSRNTHNLLHEKINVRSFKHYVNSYQEVFICTFLKEVFNHKL